MVAQFSTAWLLSTHRDKEQLGQRDQNGSGAGPGELVGGQHSSSSGGWTEGVGAALNLQSALGTAVTPACKRTMANPSRCLGHLVGYIE